MRGATGAEKAPHTGKDRINLELASSLPPACLQPASGLPPACLQFGHKGANPYVNDLQPASSLPPAWRAYMHVQHNRFFIFLKGRMPVHAHSGPTGPIEIMHLLQRLLLVLHLLVLHRRRQPHHWKPFEEHHFFSVQQPDLLAQLPKPCQCWSCAASRTSRDRPKQLTQDYSQKIALRSCVQKSCTCCTLRVA